MDEEREGAEEGQGQEQGLLFCLLFSYQFVAFCCPFYELSKCLNTT